MAPNAPAPIPERFVHQHGGPCLYARQVNVTINIAQVTSPLGGGDFANPLAARVGYDGDERVIRLITRSIG